MCHISRKRNSVSRIRVMLYFVYVKNYISMCTRIRVFTVIYVHFQFVDKQRTFCIRTLIKIIYKHTSVCRRVLSNVYKITILCRRAILHLYVARIRVCGCIYVNYRLVYKHITFRRDTFLGGKFSQIIDCI